MRARRAAILAGLSVLPLVLGACAAGGGGASAGDASVVSAHPSAADQLEFFDALETRERVSYDDAIHAALLFEQEDSQTDWAKRVAVARQNGLLPGDFDRPPNGAITTGEAADLLLRAMVSRAGRRRADGSSPAAATAQFQAQGLLPETSQPKDPITGRQFVSLLTGARELIGLAPAREPTSLAAGEPAKAPPKAPATGRTGDSDESFDDLAPQPAASESSSELSSVPQPKPTNEPLVAPAAASSEPAKPSTEPANPGTTPPTNRRWVPGKPVKPVTSPTNPAPNRGPLSAVERADVEPELERRLSMKRIGAAACGILLALSVVAGSALAEPNDKKPVRKPVIDLGSSAKQRRAGQVMPGDAGPTPSAPAPKSEAPTPQSAPPTPLPPPPQQQQPAPTAMPAAPIPSAEPRKAILPPPKLHASVAAMSSTPASAQVRRLGVMGGPRTGGTGAKPSDTPWTELTAAWADDAPIEVRVGVHAPVVIRITGAADAGGGEPPPPTLFTLWPMARVMIGPELVDGRWVPGVRLVRGQVTVHPDSAGSSSVLPGAWSSVVRTPDRLVPIAGGGARVAYDTVRSTRMWLLLSE